MVGLRERIEAACAGQMYSVAGIMYDCDPEQAPAKVQAEYVAQECFNRRVLRADLENSLGQMEERELALAHFDYRVEKEQYAMMHPGERFPSFQQWRSPKTV